MNNPTQDERLRLASDIVTAALAYEDKDAAVEFAMGLIEAHTQEREEQARKEGYEQGYNAAKT